MTTENRTVSFYINFPIKFFGGDWRGKLIKGEEKFIVKGSVKVEDNDYEIEARFTKIPEGYTMEFFVGRGGGLVGISSLNYGTLPFLIAAQATLQMLKQELVKSSEKIRVSVFRRTDLVEDVEKNCIRGRFHINNT
jgi:hypothetical protein